MIRQLLAFLVLLAPISAAHAAHSGEWQKVRIGIIDNYPPFSFVNQRSQPAGFDIDIATALCRQMKARCDFIREEWSDLIPALVAGRFDAIIASMSITEDRLKVIDFSARYYQTPAAIAVHRDSNIRDTSPAGMKGRVMGVVTDTLQAQYAERVYAPAGVRLKYYSGVSEEQYDLERRRLDAVFADKLILHDWLQKTDQGRCCVLAGEIRDPEVVGQGVGVGLRKADTALKERINKALKTLLADGTYQQINDKYFPFSIY